MMEENDEWLLNPNRSTGINCQVIEKQEAKKDATVKTFIH